MATSLVGKWENMSHPVERSIHSEWFVNSFRMVFGHKFLTELEKKFLIEKHHKAIYKPVRIDRSSYSVCVCGESSCSFKLIMSISTIQFQSFLKKKTIFFDILGMFPLCLLYIRDFYYCWKYRFVILLYFCSTIGTIYTFIQWPQIEIVQKYLFWHKFHPQFQLINVRIRQEFAVILMCWHIGISSNYI